MPADHLADQQVDKAQKQGKGAGLADGAAVDTQEHVQQAGELGSAVCQLLQRRCGGLQLHHRGHCAAGHGGEGDEHKHAGGDGGVCKVAAQTAEEALDHHNGEHGADDALPDGHIGAQVQAQKKAGDHCAQIAHGLLMAGDQVKQELRQNRADDAGEQDYIGPHSEDDRRGDGSRKEGNDHIQHDPAGGSAAVDMRRG